MNTASFIENYLSAFGQAANLPIVLWYSVEPMGETSGINGCFFKIFDSVLAGEVASLDANVIRCAGGKFYTGFSEMPEFVPNFVSIKERYKQTPDMVLDYIDQLGVPRASDNYLNFARIDKVDSFDEIEVVFFFATPDVLSGLTTWAYFDNNAEDTVSAIFGSGCATVVTQAIVENRKGGRRTFLGLFDPSVRSHISADVLSFAIPMSRFREMYHTMTACCLFDTAAWAKVKERINS